MLVFFMFSVTAECDATSFTITVRPYSFADSTPFFGAIYADPAEDFSSLPIACRLVDDGNSVYSLTMTHADGDGPACAPPVVRQPDVETCSHH